ncbi:MAG: nitroreductase family protein [Chloroflexi bacterium]|nr:nitroreductase family protein [Chloroflexota bacterium]
MEYDAFLDLVKRRRNVRHFKPDPLPEGAVEKMIEAAHWANSGSNAQPWEFIVVTDPARKEALLDIYHQYEVSGYHLESTRGDEFKHPARAKPPGAPRFKEAPAIIVVAADQRTMLASVMAATLYPENHVFHMNVATAVQILHLAATSLGLATEWVSIGNCIEERVKAALDIPPDFRVYVMVPVGHPARPPSAGVRRDVKDIIHYDSYCSDKYRTDEQVLDFIRGLRRASAPRPAGK